ncbi:transcriptional regulator [Methanosarcinales archaeon]|uniref:Transcriptional regulator n=1 Tax=Candidatus Syntropharchaeum caldarium TaxID=1838285 RepID=A0A1F2P9Z4_9EURY|nr:MAG: transcriptional regulator [Candidatus Syntrophoarchaeum caldarius]RLG35166.1 MAG: transcriptional regulator [Methanosarcinales archaeon]
MAESENLLEIINSFFDKIGFRDSESKIYALLIEKKRPLSVREISEELGLSVRTVREKVRTLCNKNLLKREVVEKKWLEYRYRAKSPKEVWSIVKSRMERAIDDIEKEFNRNSDK